MKYLLPLLCLALLPIQHASAQGIPVSTPTGLWEFNNSSNILQATIGSNLTQVGGTPAFSSTLSDGGKSLTGVITTVSGTANRLLLSNPVGGNGGGSYTNEYTFLFDILSPVASRSSWRCLFQTNTSNNNDGDYFIRNSDDKLGIASPLGYSSNAFPDSVWKRLVITFDINATLNTSYVRAYVDGVLFHTHSFSGGRDSTYGLESSVLMFGDNSNENAALNVGALGYWGKTLTDAEISALGSAGSPIQGATVPLTTPTALWEFDFPQNPSVATIGSDLVPSGSGFSAATGAFAGDGAQERTAGNSWRATNSVGANGGGSYTNRYTMLWDVFLPTDAAGQWKCLWQTNPSNDNDGDLFINPSGQLGTAAGLGGYSSNGMAAGNWYRVVLRVINGQTNGATIWVNGSNWYTATTSGGVDGRYGLESTFLLFADDNGEDGKIRATNVAYWNDALGDSEIAALGGVTGRLTTLPRPTVNILPVITEGETMTLNAPINSSSQITLHVTDADNDPISWTISGAAGHGSTQITSSNNTQAAISYTPSTNYSGPDTFTVRAFDGKAADTILVNVTVVNGAPVINEGESYNLSAIRNGGVRTVTFTAADPNNNPLAWSIATPATHGTATVTGDNNTEGVIGYTPASNYSGPDSFVVRVTDGVLHDEVTVNVSVTDPAAAPTLTIIAAHGTATPPPGTYSHPAGSALTNSCTDETGATTRHVCTGWTMTGDGPATGESNTMNMTLTRDSVLAWNFRTEHRVETATVGNGSISTNSGWFEAGIPLQITATPAAGHYFSGWTGDTAGCIIGGKNIVIPMDRARSTITANFALNGSFTFIALPDTQNYTSISSPSDLFTRQTQWILDNKETMNIRFVTHLGDIVNSPSSSSQWTRATNAMNLMNNQMPYGTCPGNHDIASGDTNFLQRFGPNPSHSSSTGRWIDPDTSQRYDWYRGSSPRGYSSYQVVNVNGRDFMFLHMDMDACDQDLAWAAGVLNAHPKVLTMVTTHNYLAETGGSGTYGSGTGQRGYTAQANIGTWGDRPDTNRPVDVFNAIVKPFNQVFMVICGHNFATYNLQKTNNFGKPVHEVLVDYQSLPNGGNGFLRIMEFQPSQNLIVNTSYSPYLGRYVDPNNNADHQGMLDLHDRNGSEFNLATDFDTRFNTNLTIASIHGGVTPAAGTYSIETGTPVAITADDVVTGQTRYRPTGWNLTGGQTASGSGSSGTITQGANATLTWNYATQHYLTTTTVGDGIVSTNSGWYDAGALVNIQAQPDPGATFTQWTGDTAGCTINGATISVPVDRPRGPITAQFSSALPTFDVQIVSAWPEVSPAPSTYTYEQGQSVTFTASEIIPGSDTRRVCTGHTISGAVSQSGPETSVTLPISGNMTLTWNWKTQYLLTTEASGPGTVSASQWVDENSAATASATANPGAGFTSWTGDTALGTANGTQFEIAAMTRPVGPLTANFATSDFTLTVVSSQATTTPAPGVYAHPYGTSVDFSAMAAETNGSRQRPTGWTLTGATNASGSGSTGSVTILGDTTLTWTFAPEVLLSVSGGSEGAVLPMNTAGWYPLGANLSLQATALSPAFTFRQWTGDVPANSTNTSLALVMDQPRAVTADFAPVSSEGTPNWWLDEFTNVQGNDYLTARGNDSDGDGQPAWREFIAGMSDLDSRDLFKVDEFSINPATNTLHFTLPMRDGRLYQLMESADLAGTFTPLGAPMQPAPPLATFSIPKPTHDKRFYRVDVTLGPVSAADADPAAASSAPLPGSVVREMATIPAGSFIQGENTGPSTTRPEHVTHVARFKMDKFEVTRADWESVATWAQSHGYDIPVTLQYNQAPYNVPANHPAVAVTWYDAVKWCNARSEMEGRRPVYFTDALGTIVYRSGQSDLTSANVNWAGDGYRLPTESEWERASRGGIEQAQFPWGNDDGNLRANHWDYQLINGRAPAEDYPYTEKVGFFDGTQTGGAPNMANGFGLHDMAGNAWEWTWDRMGSYPADTQYDPRGPDTGTQRIQRGGSWWNYVDQANNYQRLPFPPDGTDDYGMIGFRCVRAMHPNE